MSKGQMDELVDELFCGSNAPNGRYAVPGGGPADGTELVRDTLFRYDLMDGANNPVTVQTYWDVSELGGRLWESEVRILLRVATDHPALPKVKDGRYVEASDTYPSFAYVVTAGSNSRLADESDVIPFMRAHPVEAVRQLSLLADALSLLHGAGVVHRNLWPGTVDVDTSVGGELPQLRLARFEMSRMVADLLRLAVGEPAAGAQARRLLLGRDPRAVGYVPPERLAYLYPDSGTATAEDARSDVFSLGMLVAEWFLGAFDGPAADLDDSAAVLSWAATTQEEVRRQLRIGAGLPRALADLLLSMVSSHRRERPRAGGVVEAISRRYEAMTSLWSAIAEEERLLVGFKPAEFVDTCYEWGWLDAHPGTEEGRVELAELIEQDLRKATLTHSPSGAEGILSGGDIRGKREARQVLMGTRALWFCRPYYHESAYGGTRGTPQDDLLMVRYVLSRESGRARSALNALGRGRNRLLPPVEAVQIDMPRDELTRRRQGRPPWSPLIAATRAVTTLAGQDLQREQALGWLLDFQEVELHAREYAFETVSTDGELAVVRFDEERDAARRYGSALATRFADDEARRPTFVDFFATQEDERGGTAVEVLADDHGRPAMVICSDVWFAGKESHQDALRVRVRGGARRLPARGWLRPASDRGTRVVLRRELAARDELLDRHRSLLSQLLRPRTIETRRGPWRDAPRKLVGDGAKAVVDMLATQPFFALQGPPGTGKTEVAAHAVAAYLRRETGRVLVSAQSNFALDNLAKRILAVTDAVDHRGSPRDDPELIPLRVASAYGTDRIDPALLPFRLTPQVERRQQALIGHAEQELSARQDEAALALLGGWRAGLDRCGPELTDRLRRGANVVFATCATATPEMVARSGSAATYDWVLVEEAAKAWPTELIIPMVRGLRWTLVGDHKQLPAFRRREVIDFLQECVGSDQPELSVHGERQEGYLEVFDLFRTLFRDPADNRSMRRLNTQYRMRDPICQLVSRVFYPAEEPGQDGGDADGTVLPRGTLETGRAESGHGLTAPGWLRDRAVVWLDTSGMVKDGDEYGWRNQTEVEIVRELVSQLRPRPAPPTWSEDRQRLAVLTPYRQQVRLLSEDRDLEPYVSTIHAFQGRQADVVVVSMVRDTLRGGPDRPWHNIGHLTQPELVNVMLSRARDLLVIVGDLPHLTGSGVPFWRLLGLGLAEYGTVLPADQVFLR